MQERLISLSLWKTPLRTYNVKKIKGKVEQVYVRSSRYICTEEVLEKFEEYLLDKI